MIPVAIGSAGGDCLASYGPGAGPAVLFCPPFGDEALKTARVWRDLAADLGGAGLATLRFDLPGTGNSAGNATDPDRVEAWRAAVSACADWLSQRHGGRLILFGHRFGALLALDAVGRGVCAEQLVLLDPPASGAAQARYLRARSAMERTAASEAGPDAISIGGTLVSEATLRDLNALPASPSGRCAPRTLLALHESGGPPSPWPDRLRASGCAVRLLEFEGYDDFVPHDAFRARPPAKLLRTVVDELVAAAGPLEAAAQLAIPTPHLRFDTFSEEPIRFGADTSLFGILCRPDRLAQSQPAVVLPTTGVDPCCGMARMWTELARRLARAGVMSFRFDMRGVGESGGTLGPQPLMATYSADRVMDLTSAVDRLASFGSKQVAVVGYCSGAYAAWHAALSDSRIGAVLAGNLVYLNRQDGRTEDALRLRPGASRIGTGRAGSGPTAAGKVSAVLRRLDDGAKRLVPRPVRNLLRGLSPDPVAARRHLRALVRRGCTVELVMAEDDHGHVRLRRAFGETPRLPKGAALTVIAEADHRFSDRRHLAQFIDLAAAFALRASSRPREPDMSRPRALELAT